MEAQKPDVLSFSPDRVPLLGVSKDIRPYGNGKFLFVGRKKFYVSGVTYGTFRPNDDGHDFPNLDVVEGDFARMCASGINAVRTYSVPPRWLLDAALESGLYVMVGLPWEQHITFLDDRAAPAVD